MLLFRFCSFTEGKSKPRRKNLEPLEQKGIKAMDQETERRLIEAHKRGIRDYENNVPMNPPIYLSDEEQFNYRAEWYGAAHRNKRDQA